MRRTLSAILAATMMAATLSGCGGTAAPTQTPAPTGPVQTAGNEKPYEGTTLNVLLAYGGAENAFDAFTEKTGINIEYVEISTGKALAQMQAEGGPSADVWFGGGVDSYLTAQDLGYLEPYVSPEAEQINPAYRDKDGYWTGLCLVPAGFIVNNEVLTELGLEAPKTWEDLADPKYKGEIIMASPAISGTQYAILNGTLQAWGEEKGWNVWAGINENIDFYAKGGGEPAPKVCAGEYAIAVAAWTDGIEEEYPVKNVFPEDMVPWTPAPIAIFSTSKQKEAAKVLIDYMLSEEGQQSLSAVAPRLMARDGIPVPEGLSALDSSKLLNQDIALFGVQRETLLEQWAALVGEKDA